MYKQCVAQCVTSISDGIFRNETPLANLTTLDNNTHHLVLILLNGQAHLSFFSLFSTARCFSYQNDNGEASSFEDQIG